MSDDAYRQTVDREAYEACKICGGKLQETHYGEYVGCETCGLCTCEEEECLW